MMAMKRTKGRPSADQFKRHDKYALAKKARTTRIKIDSLGALLTVIKNKCSNCGQAGHDKANCRGTGFVQAIADKMVVAIHNAQQKRKRQDEDNEEDSE